MRYTVRIKGERLGFALRGLESVTLDEGANAIADLSGFDFDAVRVLLDAQMRDGATASIGESGDRLPVFVMSRALPKTVAS
jgi:hypothetical protein